MDHTTTRAGRCDTIDRAPLLRLSRVRLVFGPSDSVAALLRAVADALEPVALVPGELRCAIGPDGCRIRVTCEIDPGRPDLARVLGHLLRRRAVERVEPLARTA
jgi:hypothetical protein